jgi:hypothetical protein
MLAAAPGDADELLGLCRLESLPEDIRGSLQRNFSAWKIQEPTDLSPRARERWASERPLACPGIAAGHFQNAKDSGYALLLVAADHATAVFRVVIFSQQAGLKFYGFKVIAQAGGGASNFFVHSVAVTKFFEGESKWGFRSRPSDGVLIIDSTENERDADMYFWADESYQHKQVHY